MGTAQLSQRSRKAANIHLAAIVVVFLGIIALYWLYYYTNLDFNGTWRRLFWYISVSEYRFKFQGSLLYIPLIYALFVFWWRGTLIVWLLAMCFAVPHIIDYAPDEIAIYTNIILLSVPLLVVAFINAEIKWRNRERKILADRESERQVYMSQIFKAQENERRRIAQELHDDTTQTLLAIANKAQSMVADEGQVSPAVRESAEWIRDSLLGTSEDIRRLSLDLRPGILDNIGLLPAVRWLVERLNKETRVETQLEIKGTVIKLSPEADVMIFRIIQEALNNIRRHAQATQAFVGFEFASGNTVRIVVKDNGQGFSPPKAVGSLAPMGKLGIIGMQQRAQFLNGSFNLDSEPGKGTTITIAVKP